ncbi:L,D-transpeptidase family protein [Nocardioides sp. CER19]|uniref:L,D-transpeptidase family protein n=1 Tax=Nocardioides sp. CER19 TaxID=3038538 RepID=UPI00244A6E0E|nr:L,D-transpeptidase family protein [Nocardioides sp. CER19]MDH2416819.1 L,D-transpeptidase family protein [Nocardioides sp. CER19]
MTRLGTLVAALLLALGLLAPGGPGGLLAPGGPASVAAEARIPADVPTFASAVPASTTQVVRTISSRRWCRQVYCTVTQAWRKDAAGWHLVRQFRSSIGAKGWGKQREGDRRSPVGVFRIKVTFSTRSPGPGPMPWRQRRATSVVSNTPGPNYNTWLEVPGVRSGNRPSMRWGWVVDYNHVRLAPGQGAQPVPGKGSGIFYHTSKPGHRWSPTAGCTQVGNPQGMRWLERWLRPGADPRVVQRL